MSDELTFVEEVAYGCTPPEVLGAMSRINSRIAQHKIDDPGEYEQTDIVAQWMSQNLRSNWQLSVTLKRVVDVVPVKVVAKSPPPINVGKTTKTDPIPAATDSTKTTN